MRLQKQSRRGKPKDRRKIFKQRRKNTGIPGAHPFKVSFQKSCISTTTALWTNYDIMTHEPKEDNRYIYPSFNCDGFLETAKPEANYGEFVHPRRSKIKLHSKRETIN
ncbi:hypothetical protein ABFV05_020316 [Capra hircus]